jgi:hypothetical protein
MKIDEEVEHGTKTVKGEVGLYLLRNRSERELGFR